MTAPFDMRDVILEAQAEVQAIMREILQEMTLPQMMTAFRQTWAQMTPEMKEQFQRERPKEYAALVHILKQGE